jgi:hypothetical protein
MAILSGNPLMQNVWNAVSAVVFDLNTNQTITLVVFALFLSAATVGVFRLIGRGKDDAKTILTGLVLVSSLISMLTCSAYLQYTRPRGLKGGPMGQDAGIGPRPTQHAMTNQVVESLAMQILLGSDSNHDGMISAEEASEAASRFINETSARTEHPGELDGTQFRAAIRHQYAPLLFHSAD